MFLRRRAVVVMGQDAPRVEIEGAMDGPPRRRTVFIEEAGWTVGKVAVAGEEITAEEDTECFAPVSRVSHGVAGKGHGTKTLPKGKFIPVRDEAIRRDRDDQAIALLARRDEVPQVPEVQDVKAPVTQPHDLPRGPVLGDPLGQRLELEQLLLCVILGAVAHGATVARRALRSA